MLLSIEVGKNYFLKIDPSKLIIPSSFLNPIMASDTAVSQMMVEHVTVSGNMPCRNQSKKNWKGGTGSETRLNEITPLQTFTLESVTNVLCTCEIQLVTYMYC